MTLRIGRIIFVVVVALSVATLPAALGFAAAVTTPTATQISASEMMPDCDHHHSAPSDQRQKTANDGACMASCALNCFSFTATGCSGIAFSSPAIATLKPVRTSNAVSSQLGSPPFRPPRS